MDFVEFPKIARLNREMILTEKLDGTNAQINIQRVLSDEVSEAMDAAVISVLDEPAAGTTLLMRAGSRSRWVTLKDDNYGFARWVHERADELFQLGEGAHFGEWWGQGIQRKYGLAEKRFSLFNVGRWIDAHTPNARIWDTEKQTPAPTCCHVVPVLYRGPFSVDECSLYLNWLEKYGSAAAPGFMRPEGIICYHTAARTLFKMTIGGDGAKGIK